MRQIIFQEQKDRVVIFTKGNDTVVEGIEFGIVDGVMFIKPSSLYRKKSKILFLIESIFNKK